MGGAPRDCYTGSWLPFVFPVLYKSRGSSAVSCQAGFHSLTTFEPVIGQSSKQTSKTKGFHRSRQVQTSTRRGPVKFERRREPPFSQETFSPARCTVRDLHYSRTGNGRKGGLLRSAASGDQLPTSLHRTEGTAPEVCDHKRAALRRVSTYVHSIRQ